jgi:glycosyltransferase involved in cell wall biosynthesis
MSRKILILYPHFPPSNLAGVHRPRLFATHLPSFGWEPVILTVHEQYYEENLDFTLFKLLPEHLRIEKVSAFSIGPFRLIGDLGLRAFFQLYRRAKKILLQENFSFLYIPIPSFYCALLGRLLHAATGIRYGIDYIDPWVHHFPGSDKVFSRHWFSSKMAKLLEPIAVKKAILITGVAEGYYKDVIERNSHLRKQAIAGAMPYGGEQRDHDITAALDLSPYLFEKNGKFQLLYAGAMLPKAYEPLHEIFKAIQKFPTIFREVEFHFVGTGKTPDDATGYNIKHIAEQYGLWQKTVFEYPQRISYADVLVHLQAADGAFVLGSTEPHYTPSKTYQSILSKKPLFAVLHQQSTAVSVVEQSRAGIVLSFNGTSGLETLATRFPDYFVSYMQFAHSFNPQHVNFQLFEEYSARAVTQKLATLIDKAMLV